MLLLCLALLRRVSSQLATSPTNKSLESRARWIKSGIAARTLVAREIYRGCYARAWGSLRTRWISKGNAASRCGVCCRDVRSCSIVRSLAAGGFAIGKHSRPSIVADRRARPSKPESESRGRRCSALVHRHQTRIIVSYDT